jgi:hypothetical protein
METQLPDIVIAGLYKNSLVLIEDTTAPVNRQQVTNKKEKQAPAAITPSKKWFFGDNNNHITIVINDASALYINDTWLATLGKLLTACKLNIGAVAIVNMHQNPVNFSQIKEQLAPQKVFLFSVSAKDLQLPFVIPDYQVYNHAGCTFMAAQANTLSEATDDATKAEKRKLWDKLKIIFNI